MRAFIERIGLVLLVVLFCGCGEEDEARRATSATDGGTHSVSDAEQAGRLFKACREGDVDAVNALLGQDPGLVHTRDAADRTALHVAGTAAVAEVLVKRGADVNARRSDGGLTKDLTPLHVTAKTDAIEIARLLLENGADVNARAMTQNNLGMRLEGMTPLCLVVRTLGSTGMIRLLLEHGADPHLRAKGWGSPIDHVREWGPHGREVLDLMLRYGRPDRACKPGNTARSPSDSGRPRDPGEADGGGPSVGAPGDTH